MKKSAASAFISEKLFIFAAVLILYGMKKVLIFMVVALMGAKAYSQNSVFCKPLMHATVSEANYSGDIVIPQTIEIGGSTYIVTAIADYAFRGCKDVTSISIPNTVTSFGSYSMAGCSYKEIILPYRVMDIAIGSLNTETLENIVVSEDNNYFTSDDGVLYNKEKTILYQYPCAKKTDVCVIPEGVRRFVSSSFARLQARELDLPSTLEWLADWNLMQTPNLVKLIVRSKKTPWCHNSFNKTLCENCILFVPDDVIEDYKNHEDWGSFKDIRPLSEASYISSPSSTKARIKAVYGLNGNKKGCVTKGLNIVVKEGENTTKLIK